MGTKGQNFGSETPRRLVRALTVLCLWAATAAACLLSPAPKSGETSGVRLEFPAQLGPYPGERADPVEGELRLLPEDTEFAKALFYPTSEKDPWDAAYCSIIRTGSDRRSIHRPEICMEGQGWTIHGSRTASIPIGRDKSLDVTVLSVQKTEIQENGESIVFDARYVYWFVGADITTPSNNERLLLSVRDNLLRNINHRWAYVSVMAYATDSFDDGTASRSPDETERFVFDLIRLLFPQIQPTF